MPWSALANVAGSVIGAITGVQQQKKEQAFNAEQAQINRDFQTAEREATQQFNVDMWNMNNEYNSPASQLKRLQDAGISPNALFGTGASPYQSSAVMSNPMSGSLAQTNSGLGSALVNAGSSLGVNTANMLKALSERDNNKYNLEWNKKTEQQRIDEMNSRIGKNWADIQKCLASAGVDNATEAQVRELTKYIAPKNELEIQTMMKNLNKLDADTRYVDKQIELVDEKIKTEGATRDLIGKQADLTDQQAKSEKERAIALKRENEFASITGIPANSDMFHVAYTLWASGNGNFERFVNNFLVPQSRADWKPEDFIVHNVDKSESSGEGSGGVNLGVFGNFGGSGGYHDKSYSEWTSKDSSFNGYNGYYHSSDRDVPVFGSKGVNIKNPSFFRPKWFKKSFKR